MRWLVLLLSKSINMKRVECGISVKHFITQKMWRLVYRMYFLMIIVCSFYYYNTMIHYKVMLNFYQEFFFVQKTVLCKFINYCVSMAWAFPCQKIDLMWWMHDKLFVHLAVVNVRSEQIRSSNGYLVTSNCLFIEAPLNTMYNQ